MTRQKLLRVVEIAEILGVSKQRADRLRREPDFPAPVDRWTRGDLGANLRRWRGPAQAPEPLLEVAANQTGHVAEAANRLVSQRG